MPFTFPPSFATRRRFRAGERASHDAPRRMLSPEREEVHKTAGRKISNLDRSLESLSWILILNLLHSCFSLIPWANRSLMEDLLNLSVCRIGIRISQLSFPFLITMVDGGGLDGISGISPEYSWIFSWVLFYFFDSMGPSTESLLYLLPESPS